MRRHDMTWWLVNIAAYVYQSLEEDVTLEDKTEEIQGEEIHDTANQMIEMSAVKEIRLIE